jgi:phosphoglucomutase
MKISPLAGKVAPESILVDVDRLIDAYYNVAASQKVEFGTSGHRGSSFDGSFNEPHILAIAQSICLYRKKAKITGPLFLGIDTHALSFPAMKSSLEVFVANGVQVMISEGDVYTPTPVISHAILRYNKGRTSDFADGVVITPSHNPPAEGGFKYNPPSGGPADTEITSWIQNQANDFLKDGLNQVLRTPYEEAKNAPTTMHHDYHSAYISDLANVIDMDAIRKSKIKIGVDPLGGAGIYYWKAIAEQYGLDITVVNTIIDPTFRFMTVDWDGKIRMDPSSAYAMESLIELKGGFDIAFACDTDHDRHGIVTKSVGLMPPNHFLSAAIYYLFQHRPNWSKDEAIGKTLVSSQMIDRVADKLGRNLVEVPVGFKWFVQGLLDGTLDGTVWTTDKDGIILGLLAAEMTAKMGRDPGELYQDLTTEFGQPFYTRIDAPANAAQKLILKNLSPDHIHSKILGGDLITSILTKAPGNGAPIGGVKVMTKNGWFAARPSGTEDIYKIYAESFVSEMHLEQILKEAQLIITAALNESHQL